MSSEVRYEGEHKIKTNGIEIAYDMFGDPGDQPILLIMGFSMQMVAWDERFCSRLAGRRRCVIRFDNRDVGHSSWLEEKGTPDLKEVIGAALQGKEITVPYRLNDMAADVVGLMDALGIRAAHLFGMSMGGMIAQVVALENPDRMKSLISFSSSPWTLDPTLPPPTAEAAAVLMKPPRLDRDGYLEDTVRAWKIIGGEGLPMAEEMLYERAKRHFDRGVNLPGLARQFAAIVASGSRRKELQRINVPTLILHGDADPLLPLAHGVATAEAVPGAKLHIIKGLGHEVPPAAWEEIIDAVVGHTES